MFLRVLVPFIEKLLTSHHDSGSVRSSAFSGPCAFHGVPGTFPLWNVPMAMSMWMALDVGWILSLEPSKMAAVNLQKIFKKYGYTMV